MLQLLRLSVDFLLRFGSVAFLSGSHRVDVESPLCRSHLEAVSPSQHTMEFGVQSCIFAFLFRAESRKMGSRRDFIQRTGYSHALSDDTPVVETEFSVNKVKWPILSYVDLCRVSAGPVRSASQGGILFAVNNGTVSSLLPAGVRLPFPGKPGECSSDSLPNLRRSGRDLHETGALRMA